MGNNNRPVDLYTCRLLNTGNKKNLPKISVSLECVGEKGKIAYLDESRNRIIVMECVLPWKEWQMDTTADLFLLEGCLQGLINKMEDLGLGIVTAMAITVPYAFSGMQRRLIRHIAENLGVKNVALYSVGMFNCMSRYLERMEMREVVTDIVCFLTDCAFEVTAAEMSDGIVESLGTVGIRCKQGWDQLSKADFEKRINSELSQFFKDSRLMSNENNDHACPENEYHIYICGKRNEYVERRLFELTGRWPEMNPGSAVVGGLLQCLKWEGKDFTEKFMRLSTQEKNIWIGLGENGEREVVINRYSVFPIKKSVSLLVTTEKNLGIYEGNFTNASYDQLLSEISLEEMPVEESKEIECSVDIDSKGRICLTVLNHEKKVVVDRYEVG